MDLTTRLRGKRIAAVLTNGHVLRIHTEDGAEIDIVWLDGEGRPLKGKPSVHTHGLRLVARGMQDLIHFPNLRKTGET